MKKLKDESQLSFEEIVKRTNNGKKRLKVILLLDLDQVLDGIDDFGVFEDFLEEKINMDLGFLLEDVRYKVVGGQMGGFFLEVSADAKRFVTEADEYK